MPDKKTEIVKTGDEKLAEFSGYTVEQVAVIKNTVAKGTNNTELALFFSVCKTVGLNPFLKQVWCYKDNKDNLLVFTGRDGFLAIGQKDTRWNGMLSSCVCANDTFELDIPNGKVNHKINTKERGEPLGAYAIIKPKGCELPTVEWAEFKVYNKGWNVWKTNPKEMIQKVAETHCLKKAFGIQGLQPEYDFVIDNNVAKSVGEQIDQMQEIKNKIIDGIDKYEGEDKETLRTMCATKNMAGEFTMEFAQEIAKTIGVEL